jgi:hypothetical protein
MPEFMSNMLGKKDDEESMLRTNEIDEGNRNAKRGAASGEKLQSFSRKSQSIVVSGAFREQPNNLFRDSFWEFSGLHVCTSHMRNVTWPSVVITRASSML